MKVCFLINSLECGGAERTVSYLANWLVAHGEQVDIVLYGGIGVYPLHKAISIHCLPINRKRNIISRLFTNLRRVHQFNRYFKKNKPDCIFCMMYLSALYTLFRKQKCPLIISERSSPTFLRSKTQKFVRNRIFKKANAIVFQTQRARDYYKSIVGEKGVIIPNAVGNMQAYEVPDIAMKDRQPVISAMGRLCKEKNYESLIQAFKIVQDAHEDFYLHIYGANKLEYKEKHLDGLICEMHLEEKVIFKGMDPNALLNMSDSACYVLSSISEGMPNALIEAMAAGMPCVATDCPNGPAEIIQNEVNGLLVPMADAEALAAGICRMIEDVDFASSCIREARRIKETNSIERICQLYYDYICETIMNSK